MIAFHSLAQPTIRIPSSSCLKPLSLWDRVFIHDMRSSSIICIDSTRLIHVYYSYQSIHPSQSLPGLMPKSSTSPSHPLSKSFLLSQQFVNQESVAHPLSIFLFELPLSPPLAALVSLLSSLCTILSLQASALAHSPPYNPFSWSFPIYRSYLIHQSLPILSISHIDAFARALSAPDLSLESAASTTHQSPSNTAFPLPSSSDPAKPCPSVDTDRLPSTPHRVEKVSALSDFAPINTKVKRYVLDQTLSSCFHRSSPFGNVIFSFIRSLRGDQVLCNRHVAWSHSDSYLALFMKPHPLGGIGPR